VLSFLRHGPPAGLLPERGIGAIMTHRADHDCRPARGRLLRACLLSAVLVFAGLGAAGIEWLRARWATRYSATAEVTLPECWCHGTPDRQVGATPLDSDRIASDILGAATGMPRWDAHVTVDRPGAGAIRIVATLADAEPDSAMRQVNDLVVGYAAKLRMRATSGLLERAAEIGSAGQRARQELRSVQEGLDGLIGRAVSEAARASAVRPSEPDARAAADSGPTRLGSETASSGEAPERTAARKRLEQLQRHRAHLLVDRTPIHPEVLQFDTLIAEAEKRLAAIPLQVPEAATTVAPKEPRRSSKSDPAAQSAREAPARTAPASPGLTELSQSVQRQRDQVDRVSLDLQQTPALDLQAAQCLVRGDDLHLRPAEHAEPIAVRLELGDLLLVALAGGLMAAAGVGMIWTGASFDPPLTSRRSVEQCLAVPVVGAITVEQGFGGSPGSPPVDSRWRLPYVVGGLTILAVYLVFLLHPLLAR